MLTFLSLLTLQGAAGGSAVLQRMHDRYAGKWYQSLTFVQTTVITRGEAKPDTATWWEALKGSRLRIDLGAPTSGSGVISTPDTTYSMRDGALARTTAQGNPFIPLIMGVYLQPVAQTEKELRAFGFALERFYSTRWQGRRVSIIGAATAADTASAQFWVDEDRLVVVRVRGALLGQSSADIRLAGYVELEQGWLATEVDIRLGGVHQTEQYRDWRAGTELPDAFFTVAGWSTAPHWAVKSQ
jgi:hypothetical protein